VNEVRRDAALRASHSGKRGHDVKKHCRRAEQNGTQAAHCQCCRGPAHAAIANAAAANARALLAQQTGPAADTLSSETTPPTNT